MCDGAEWTRASITRKKQSFREACGSPFCELAHFLISRDVRSIRTVTKKTLALNGCWEYVRDFEIGVMSEQSYRVLTRVYTLTGTDIAHEWKNKQDCAGEQ